MNTLFDKVVRALYFKSPNKQAEAITTLSSKNINPISEVAQFEKQTV
jgi:hypothetical protein